MRKFFTLFILSALLLIPNIGKANTVTVPSDPATEFTTSTYLPIALNTSGDNYAYHSVSQQLYYASELTDASSTRITALTFYYTEGTSFTRKLRVWMNSTDLDNFQVPEGGEPANKTPNMVNPGTKVFSGDVSLIEGSSYTITFDTPYDWDGTSNIIVTVFDSTGLKNNIYNYPSPIRAGKHSIFATEGAIRFLHKANKDYATFTDAGWTVENLASTVANSSSVANRKYVDKITFTFAAAALPPATPSDLAASSVGVTTASLSWSAVDGATSYKLYHSTSAEGIYTELASPTTNSYEWSGLTANTTYYVKVAAVNEAGSSDLSEPISFTTLVPHIHDGITFEPWSNPSAMPTSGNYYLATDVAFGWESSDVALTGDLNLCLNGHEANLAFFKIVVPDDKTLAIYDNVGGGKITGFVASEVGAFDIYAKALIVVYNGAELDLHQGIIENTYIPDEDGQSYAIYSNGTLRLSGDVLINSNSADIYLYSSNIITIDGAINNSEKHTVWKNGGAFTTGWSTHMSGEDPRDYFESANSARSVCLDGDEASLRLLLTLSESSLNSSISTSSGQLADVNLTRSLSSSQYNTFCLPFALSAAQMEEFFGAGYDLEEFVSSSLEDDILNLSFNKATALVAGKPYLLQPAVDVENPVFEGVTIGAVSPADQTSDTYISFHGTFAPTELEGGNKNLLFLGAGNELFYPSTTANIYGFRAYFEVKGAAQKNGIRARIVKKENTATGFETVSGEGLPVTGKKILRNGQLFIIRDGKTYNAQGQLVK